MNSPARFTTLTARGAVLGFALLLAMPVVQAQASLEPIDAKPALPTPVPGNTVLLSGPHNTMIHLQDVLAELQRAPEPTKKAMLSRIDSLQQVAKNMLTRRSFAALAEREGLANDPLVAATLLIARDRILAEAQLQRIDAINTPSKAVLDANVANVYNANGERFEQPAQTHARHILLDSKDSDALPKAKALLAQLRAGASFDEMVKTNSIDTGSAAKGGDLGFFPTGKMVKPFDDAVAALAKPGDLSEPVLTQFGYHIIRLEERRPKRKIPLEEVREQLAEEILTNLRNAGRTQQAEALSADFVFNKDEFDAVVKSYQQP